MTGSAGGRDIAQARLATVRSANEHPPTRLATEAGEVLRQIRTSRSLSLRQVTIRSAGRFKPSSIASYERGERQISLERLFALAALYDVEPEKIVRAIAFRMGRPTMAR